MANNPRGLVPHRHLHGMVSFRTGRYIVSANNPTAMFIGDPVELGADGHVRVIDTSAPSANERGILGVVRSVYDSNQRPLTHSLPATGQFLDGSTAGFVDVVDDPDVVYLINSDTTAVQADIGQYVRVTAGSANSVVGISGFSLRMADVTASSVGHRFMIVRTGSNELDGVDSFTDQRDLEVIISDHHFRRRQKRVGEEN